MNAPIIPKNEESLQKFLNLLYPMYQVSILADQTLTQLHNDLQPIRELPVDKISPEILALQVPLYEYRYNARLILAGKIDKTTRFRILEEELLYMKNFFVNFSFTRKQLNDNKSEFMRQFDTFCQSETILDLRSRLIEFGKCYRL